MQVFVQLDGRSDAWLAKELEVEGIVLTASAISNYRHGIRQPHYATLEAINRILSIRATSVRTAAT